MNIIESVKYAMSVIAKDVNLPRMAMVQRVTMIAASRFTEENYYTNDAITCNERAMHYGLKIGSVRRIGLKLNNLPVKEAATLIRQCNAVAKKLI